MNWSVEEKEENVHVIRVPYRRSSDWRQYVLLSADRHHDNPKTLWDLERKHLAQAREREAVVVDAGDLFCAMQGKGDRRGSKADVRPEHQKGNYLDALVDEAAAFYSPYKDHFAVLGRGNHDEAIVQRCETDLVSRLADRLGCHTGGYRGWVRFLFEREEAKAGRQSVTLFYTHGPGGSGGGEASRGTTKATRRAVYLPDADIVLSGHIHESWIMELPRHRLTQAHRQTIDTQYHVQTATYKNEFGVGGRGWANEREMPPKPLGAWWLVFRYEDDRIRFGFERAD